MINLDIAQELSQNFLDFSHEANCQRAFADARDGLKPGQRAALWEMFIKGYSSNKPHVKAAKISGGTIATWWPHSSTAVYETFARMSQNWINNIPEVDWHGANGSVQISGEPAADRYCEARLAKSTEEGLFQGIKKKNVPMKLNFSEDEEWPIVLPALYPRLMVNGCQGVGSTVANNWLPNSLDELAVIIKEYLSTGEIDYNKLAPSFPSGGIIINKDEVSAIYKTGKGKAIVRGKVECKGNLILITELPYQVYVEPFIEQVRNLVIKEEITGIANILNKSNKKQLLIEIECDGSQNYVLNQLYSKTDLQKSYSANQFALVDKTPRLLTFKEYIDIYLAHNYECIKKEYQFDLEKSTKRLEIVEGLVKALEDIDNIITLIKKSDSSANAIENLMKQYQFTQNQAKAIVDMKLGRLARLEKVELNQEKEDLLTTIENCNNVIGSNEKQKQIYLERFTDFVTKYPNPRKTELTQINLKASKEEKEIEFIEPEKVVVILDGANNIKRIPTSSYKTQNRNSKGVKTQKDITKMIIRATTADHLLIFSNKGKVYKLLINNIPQGTNASAGTSAGTLVQMEPSEKVTTIYSIYHDSDAKYILFTTKQGLIKRVLLEEYSKTQKKTGIIATKLNDNDELASITLIKDENILIITKQGMCVKIKSADVALQSKVGKGTKGITLKENDEVVAVLPIRNEKDDLAIFTRLGEAKKTSLEEYPLTNRACKGVLCTSKNSEVAAATLVSDEDSILICGDKTSICVAATDIPSLGRTSVGNLVIKGNHIVSVTKA